MKGFVDFQAGDMRWQARDDLQLPALFAQGGLRLTEWLDAGLARVVKQGQHRTVYRVQLPGLDFHLKHYPLADTRAWLRQLVRPSKARGEHERTLAVAQRGVPTLESLAIGEGPGPAQASYLMTRTLPDATPVNEFLEQSLAALPTCAQTRLRQVFAVELGSFLARMHHAGVTHEDLHPGNLLMQFAGEVPRLYLIDLQAVHLGRPLSWSRSRDNLVLFNRWFILRASRPDRLRFWCAYEKERRELEGQGSQNGAPATHSRFSLPPAAHSVRQVEEETQRSNLAFWRHHDPRCVGDNRYFRQLSGDGVVGHAVTDLDEALVARLLANPDEPFCRSGVVMLKDSRTSTVAELSVGERRLIYKRFNLTSWTDPLTALVRAAPALRSYRMGHALRWRGLPTPRPLLVLQRRRAGLPAEGYLLTEKLPNAHHLLDYLNDRAACADPTPVSGLVDQLAHLLRTLHQRKIAHRDLKAANLLTSSEPWRVQHPDRPVTLVRANATWPQVWLIDLVGVVMVGKLTRRMRVKNLMRLAASFLAHPLVSRCDKLRFLRTYLGCGLRSRVDWKWWWRQIDKAVQAKILRNQRNGRTLV